MHLTQVRKTESEPSTSTDDIPSGDADSKHPFASSSSRGDCIGHGSRVSKRSSIHRSVTLKRQPSLIYRRTCPAPTATTDAIRKQIKVEAAIQSKIRQKVGKHRYTCTHTDSCRLRVHETVALHIDVMDRLA